MNLKIREYPIESKITRTFIWAGLTSEIVIMTTEKTEILLYRFYRLYNSFLVSSKNVNFLIMTWLFNANIPTFDVSFFQVFFSCRRNSREILEIAPVHWAQKQGLGNFTAKSTTVAVNSSKSLLFQSLLYKFFTSSKYKPLLILMTFALF